MRTTRVNAYIAVLAITILGSMASFVIVKIATDTAYADEFANVDYATLDHNINAHHKASAE